LTVKTTRFKHLRCAPSLPDVRQFWFGSCLANHGLEDIKPAAGDALKPDELYSAK